MQRLGLLASVSQFKWAARDLLVSQNFKLWQGLESLELKREETYEPLLKPMEESLARELLLMG